MVTLMVHARKRVRWRLWRTESDLTETEECDLHQDASPTNWRETDSSVFRHKRNSCALAGVGLAPAVYHEALLLALHPHCLFLYSGYYG